MQNYVFEGGQSRRSKADRQTGPRKAKAVPSTRKLDQSGDDKQ
jgi:hypothetical protein